MRRPDALTWVFALPLAVLALVIVGVLAALVSRLSWGELWAALSSAETLFALKLSLWTSLTALGIAALFALPAAYVLARHRFPGQTALEIVLDLPLVMPPLVTGIGLLFLFGRRLLGAPLADWGIEVLFSPLGVVVAQSFVAAIVLLRAGRGAFAAVAPCFADAARSLRASPFDVFLTVELPLAVPGLAGGMVLAWSRSVGEFGATLMLAGATRGRTETLPTAVFLNIATGETGVAVACSLILLAMACLLLLGLRALRRPPPLGG